MLELKNIYKSYITGDFKQIALNGINLKFRQKEFVAILGPSGSGKTTCLNIVGGLDNYDDGDLIINGKSTKNFKDSDWDAYRNNSVGFIFQSYNLISHLSIMENVEMGMTLSGISNEKKHKKATEVLEKVGLKEHIHKKPNQLSGGQMQRVAIARALSNDPDIILADEPTGALDTKTSIQIMDIIKEIAKEKLVIMVTHNPELAKDYADRIVEFKDGNVISDSNEASESAINEDYKLKKTSMSFITALKLSGRNIATKKWRTALTAFASSIGIIGIALVLSLSNGFKKQISEFESNTLSGFPIMITESTSEVDVESMKEQRNEFLGISKDEDSVKEKVIYPYDPLEGIEVHTNIFSDEYINYIESMSSDLLAGISYTRLVNMNILRLDGDISKPVNQSLINFSAYPDTLNSNGDSYLENNYNLLQGSYPKEITDLVMVVDNKNRVDYSILDELGIDSSKESISFDDVIGKEFKVIFNNDYYKKVGDTFIINSNPSNLIDLYNNKNAITIKIVGVIRANDSSKIDIIPVGIAHSDELSIKFIDNAQNSEIVKEQEKVNYNVLTGEKFLENNSVNPMMNVNQMISGQIASAPITKESVLASFGAIGTPSLITIYPKDFNDKDEVLDYLNNWNNGKSKEDSVIYTDMAKTFTDLIGGLMNAITLVLIAFAAISLVVSLIMIGIITYISVLERTKEIGVLRALGARKKDITRVFNAETFLIGTCSGILGIIIAYLLTIPINNIIYNMTQLESVAKLNPMHAMLLVIISVSLTMLGGMIPAKMAAKKDPVEALRSE